MGQESLGEVLGVMTRTAAAAGEGVEGFPVDLAQFLEGTLPVRVGIRPQLQHHGPAGVRKRIGEIGIQRLRSGVFVLVILRASRLETTKNGTSDLFVRLGTSGVGRV